MTLEPGSRIGPYEVVSLLGSGGMGEVYRARDGKLQRDVAIKILPPAFASDPDRLARFEREAKVLASLNHPNIGAIYGTVDGGSAGAFPGPNPPHVHDVGRIPRGDGAAGPSGSAAHALVLELVDGLTLADRIAQGPVPLDEALPIAKQIAEALEAAHEHGVIHRDLKPANVKLRPDGTVKVLDFGLARAIGPAEAGPHVAQGQTLSPTMISPAATQIGVILGTAAYMSPEQAKGKPVDRRTDMWAFGCVLFEMITGQRAFDGDDVTDFVVAVLSREPDWTKVPAATPLSIDRLLRRCLAKDPRNRLADASAARLEIADAASAPIAAAGAPSTDARVPWLPWAVAAMALVAAVVLIATWPSPPPAPGAVRFALDPPPGTTFTTAPFYAVSPDGGRIVFEAISPGGRRTLWLRRLDAAAASEIPGTDGARAGAWSPDGQSFVFFARGKLVRIDTAGGGALVLGDAPAGGAAWVSEDVILYGGTGIFRIAASGGSATPVTTLDTARGDAAHISPTALPDGRRFVFLAVNKEPEASALVLASLDGDEPRILLKGTSNAVYADGHLFYARAGALMAHPFDADSGELSGDPVVVSDTVRETGGGRAGFGAAGGTIVFDSARDFPQAELAVVSRQGQEIAVLPAPGPYHTMWPSPDFRRVVVESGSTQGGTDLWIIDSDRGSRTRLTSQPTTEGHPVWSPDGARIVFFAGAVGARSQLLVASPSGVGEPRVIMDTPSYKQPSDWSRDGRLIVFEEQNGTTGWDIGVVPADGSEPPKVVLKSSFAERAGALSPDGRFLAYASTETGPSEIFVVNFPDVTEKWPVSAGGGLKPRWRHDGRELIYVTPSGALMSVTVKAGTGFVTSAPQRLFDVDLVQSDGWDYALSTDGQRLLTLRNSGTYNAQLSVIANWASTVRK